MSELSNRKAMPYEYISQFSYFEYQYFAIESKDEVSLKKRSLSKNIIQSVFDGEAFALPKHEGQQLRMARIYYI